MVERSQQEVWRLTPWLVVVLCLGNFVLMAFDAREITSGQRMIRIWTQTVADFVQSPVTTVSSGLAGYFGSIANLRSAQDENEQFKQRIQELEVELKANESMAAENERLRGLLGLKDEGKYKILAARIIGRDPSIWFESSIIDRGSMDGVKLNMPIVTDGGLVGRVTAVGPLTSQVDLITHDKSGVGGIVGELSGSNALGVIGGSGKRNVVEMNYVPGSVDVQVGQTVYSSGQDGIYPAGLKIGTIVEVKSGSATTPHVITIAPAANIDSMKEVAVLIYEPPPREPFEQKLPNAPKTPKGK
jgi:rod shape-determining protein MreC